jgi:hypothetical protein
MKEQEERKPMYFRDGSIGVRQFQELGHPQQKEYVSTLLELEEEVLDSSDKYILNFFTKVYFPDYKKKDKTKSITVDI